MSAHILLWEGPEPILPPEHAESDGPFHEWLLRRFPTGFGGGRQGVVLRHGGADLVPLEDWDFQPEAGEVVALFVAPAGAELTLGAILTKVLISMAVSIVLSVAMMALFPAPTQPAYSEPPAAAATYSLAYPQNETALHNTLPVLYGRVTYAPPFAMSPHSWFEDNEHYIAGALILTCGDCEVEAVAAGASDVDELPGGAFVYRPYRLADHGGEHGRIAADLGFWEDVFTSPDVAGLELRAATRDQQHSVSADFLAPGTIRIFVTGDEADAFEVGAEITVSGTSENNGSFTIAAIEEGTNRIDLDVGAGISDESAVHNSLATFSSADARPQGLMQVWTLNDYALTGALDLVAGENVRLLGEGLDQYGVVDSYSYGLSYEGHEDDVTVGRHSLRLRRVSGDRVQGVRSSVEVMRVASPASIDTSGIPRWTGPFRIGGPGQELEAIEIDLEFRQGLYTANAETGALSARTVDLVFQIQRVDDDGAKLGDWEAHPVSVSTEEVLTSSEPLNTALRLTRKIELGGGQWRIRARRITEDSGQLTVQDECVWSLLKGLRVLSDRPVYGDVTLLGFKAKAGPGFAQQTSSMIRTTCLRHLAPLRDPYEPALLGPSRSGVRAVYDMVCRSDYGLGLPADAMALAEMRSVRASHADAGLTFNHVFREQMSAWEAFKLALRPALAAPLNYAGKLGIQQRGPKAARSLLISPANAIPGSVRVRFGFRASGDPDGLKVVWTDPMTQAQQEALWPPSALRPTEVQIAGLDSAELALDHAKVEWRLLKGARITAEWKVKGEGKIARKGDRVGFVWPLFGWGDAALLVAADGRTLTLDRPLPEVAIGSVGWAALRDEDGSVVGPVRFERTGAKEILLDEDPSVALHELNGDQEPTHIAFGSTADFVFDLVIQEVAPEAGQAKITAQGYLEAAYSGSVFEGLVT